MLDRALFHITNPVEFNIGDYLVRNGLMVKELVEASALSESAIMHWQSGRKQISASNVRYLLLLERVKNLTREWPIVREHPTRHEKRARTKIELKRRKK